MLHPLFCCSNWTTRIDLIFYNMKPWYISYMLWSYKWCTYNVQLFCEVIWKFGITGLLSRIEGFFSCTSTFQHTCKCYQLKYKYWKLCHEWVFYGTALDRNNLLWTCNWNVANQNHISKVEEPIMDRISNTASNTAGINLVKVLFSIFLTLAIRNK
jgi:hypothetical protein